MAFKGVPSDHQQATKGRFGSLKTSSSAPGAKRPFSRQGETIKGARLKKEPAIEELLRRTPPPADGDPADFQDFPPVYYPLDALAAPPTESPDRLLDPRLERLIDLVCSRIGSEAQEIAELKAQARADPVKVTSLLRPIYEQQVLPAIESESGVNSLGAFASTHPESFVFEYQGPDACAFLCLSRDQYPWMSYLHLSKAAWIPLEHSPFEQTSSLPL